MGLEPERLFLDTSFLDRVYRQAHSRSKAIYFELKWRKYTNNYVLKEFYRLLFSEGRSQQEISLMLEEIRHKCIVIDTPKEKAKAIKLSDHSDAPIVAGAKAVDATLVTADRKLAKEAAAYVKVLLLRP